MLHEFWRNELTEDAEDIDERRMLQLYEQRQTVRQRTQSSSNRTQRRRYLNRDREVGDAHLFNDYFFDDLVYPDDIFRRRFLMQKELFLRIVDAVKNHSKYFQWKADATGKKGLSPLQKCTVAIRQLAYGVPADQYDEYLRIAETTIIQCLFNFCRCVIEVFRAQYLRRPNAADIQHLLEMHEQRHSFPDMLGSLDWSRNDINVLNESPLFNDVLQGNAPEPSRCSNQTAVTVNGFNSWKKVRNGKARAFLSHIGKDNVSSPHRNAEKECEDLMNQPQHISRRFDNFNDEQIATNRLRLKARIHVVLLLAFQGIPFKGHDEKSSSSNRGNFLEFLDVLSMYNDELSKAIAKAPKNAKYTSHDIQKQILHVLSMRVKNVIHEEIGVAKYYIIVDEARDESKREQVSIVLRFVDTNGFIQEHFFGLIHVSDTAALTLKDAIYSSLAHYNLDVQNIRGQGYDGSSNMRGEFNGLQVLIIKDCRSAYYVHCFAHRLQLALVATLKNVTPIHQFFDRLTFIVNIVGSSCKHNDELKNAHADDIAHLIAINELETGLIKMFSASCMVLLKVMDDGLPSQRADATSIYDEMTSFDFVFILHLMKEIMGITDILCQTLQSKSQDIINAMKLVLSTKNLLQQMRDNRRGRARARQDNFTIEHHYQVDLFYASIDSQLQEINGRFSDDAMELLILSNALNPQNAVESFKVEDICKLVEKFYAEDFTRDEKEQLEMQLKHYEYNIVKGPNYNNLATISELCQWLVKTNKSVTYNLSFRVIVLVLTLPVSTATTEQSFSAMNIVKTRLRSKMEDGFLSDALMIYIEREIARNVIIEAIIEDFENLKERRIPFS
ncbi:zinc finger MYM-type protein 1-like [Zingiber officinale]|uniref:zinc finger MYM-type protein 1-like n=1 Tax=Zingiber officinale TaxID=94328 RepID=UPI001C4D3F64|nr:zinc finger MYM-type protein 1-like [Zingiber officinale]